MSLAGSLGLKSIGQSIASTVANLAGQAVSMLRLTLTQVTGQVALQMTDGARLKLGMGTTDYLTSDGATKITAAGAFEVTSNLNANGQIVYASATLNWTDANATVFFNNTGGATGQITSSISAANAGATAASSMLKFYPQNALTATDWILSLGTIANAASVFAVAYNGSIQLPSTDSSGTPGAATIDQATGRSAIALGTASAVITNSLVTAASHVFISPRLRDGTGLLPLVTTIAAGSFTVSTLGNCTAALPFDWLVIT